MSDDSSNARRARAVEEAARWLAAIQSVGLSRSERAEFIDWLRASPLHVSEWLCACRLHRNLVRFSKWNGINTRVAGTGRVVSLLPRRLRGRAYPESQEVLTRRPGQRPHRRTLFAVCAGVAAIAICAAGAMTWLAGSKLQTQSGERREVTLSDGSVVDLAPFTDVRVRYRTHLRTVELVHGEALFHVAKNPERPFIVQAAGTRVRAVGTVFNVERNEQSVSVTVVEGRVAVSAREPRLHVGNTEPVGTGAEISLGVDEQVVISSNGRTTPVRKVKGEIAIAWTASQLIFDNDSVAEAARRFNLHNRVQIRVVDQKLAARRVTGVFSATDPDSFVAFVAAAGEVSVERPDANDIVLGAEATR